MADQQNQTQASGGAGSSLLSSIGQGLSYALPAALGFAMGGPIGAAAGMSVASGNRRDREAARQSELNQQALMLELQSTRADIQNKQMTLQGRMQLEQWIKGLPAPDQAAARADPLGYASYYTMQKILQIPENRQFLKGKLGDGALQALDLASALPRAVGVPLTRQIFSAGASAAMQGDQLQTGPLMRDPATGRSFYPLITMRGGEVGRIPLSGTPEPTARIEQRSENLPHYVKIYNAKTGDTAQISVPSGTTVDSNSLARMGYAGYRVIAGPLKPNPLAGMVGDLGLGPGPGGGAAPASTTPAAAPRTAPVTPAPRATPSAARPTPPPAPGPLTSARRGTKTAASREAAAVEIGGEKYKVADTPIGATSDPDGAYRHGEQVVIVRNGKVYQAEKVD
jgi:hypothetical protein